jgi:hypothetical protein
LYIGLYLGLYSPSETDHLCTAGAAVRLPKPRMWAGTSSGVQVPGLEVRFCDVPPLYRSCTQWSHPVVPASPSSSSADPQPEPNASHTLDMPLTYPATPSRPPRTFSDLLKGLQAPATLQNPMEPSDAMPCMLVTHVSLEQGGAVGTPPSRNAGEGSAVPTASTQVSIGDISAHLSLGEWGILMRLLNAAGGLPAVPQFRARSTGAAVGTSPSVPRGPGSRVAQRVAFSMTRVNVQVETQDRESDCNGLGLATLSCHVADVQAEYRSHPSQVCKVI